MMWTLFAALIIVVAGVTILFEWFERRENK